MATAEELGYSKPVGTDEIKYGDDAISKNADRCAVMYTRWQDNFRYRGELSTASVLNDIVQPGYYDVPTASVANAIGLPFGAAGKLLVLPSGYGVRQNFYTTGSSSRPNQDWARNRNASNEWEPWAQTNAALPMRRALSGSDKIRELAPGFYWVTSHSIAQLLGASNPGFPGAGAGDLTVYPGAYGRIEWSTTGLSSRPNEKWQTEKRADGSWTDWWRTDARAVVPPAPAGALGGAASGFKLVPVSVTLDGNGGSSATTRTAREERLPITLHAPVHRAQLYIGNQNLRSNERFAGALNITGVWIGKHAGNGNFDGAPTQIQGAFSTPADGTAWRSKFFSYPFEPGVEYLVNFGINAATGQQFFYHNGQSYASDNPANAGQIGHGAAGTARSVLDVALIVETPVTTPVIATLGSSTSVGTGADLPVSQNVAARLAARLQALPMHYGGAGDTMANASNFGWERWTRWADLAKPDAVIDMMGPNDTFESGMTLATFQARRAALTSYVTQHLSTNHYLTTITPRTNTTGAPEDLRRQINAWMESLTSVRDVFDFAAAISADDETVRPEYDSGDGYHFNTAGHEALAAAVNRPVTTPPVLYATL